MATSSLAANKSARSTLGVSPIISLLSLYIAPISPCFPSILSDQAKLCTVASSLARSILLLRAYSLFISACTLAISFHSSSSNLFVSAGELNNSLGAFATSCPNLNLALKSASPGLSTDSPSNPRVASRPVKTSAVLFGLSSPDEADFSILATITSVARQ